ncbi:MAG: hypothetical protein HYZ75_06935 [Elusimicrobia bacterium]|nr:hypothetical protein [Elusimicrobiota bacterium]
MKVAELRLETAWYGREALAAAAAAVSGRGRVAVVSTKAAHLVTLSAARGLDALVGRFLDEALNSQLRSEVVALNRPAAAPVLGQVLAAGFTAVPKDPLEEMDPAVAKARADETAALEPKTPKRRKR